MALIASSFAAHHISRTNLATSRGRVAAPMACGRSRWQSLPSTFGILDSWWLGGPTRGTDVVLVAGGYVVGQFLWWATWNVLGNW